MWQRFTEDARRVILLAQEEAVGAQSSHVDTEHLLLGWLRLGEQSEQVLQKAGVEVDTVRAETKRLVAQHPQGEKDSEPRLTPIAKRTLEFAADEARLARSGTIEADHVLLGLARERHGLASQILQSLGVDLDKLRVIVKSQLPENEPQPTTTAPSRNGREAGVEFKDEVADVLWSAFGWAKSSHHDVGTEQLLLALLERREDLLVEITGLDVLALKKARYKLLVNLDLFEEATQLRDEIADSQS